MKIIQEAEMITLEVNTQHGIEIVKAVPSSVDALAVSKDDYGWYIIHIPTGFVLLQRMPNSLLAHEGCEEFGLLGDWLSTDRNYYDIILDDKLTTKLYEKFGAYVVNTGVERILTCLNYSETSE